MPETLKPPTQEQPQDTHLFEIPGSHGPVAPGAEVPPLQPQPGPIESAPADKPKAPAPEQETQGPRWFERTRQASAQVVSKAGELAITAGRTTGNEITKLRDPRYAYRVARLGGGALSLYKGVKSYNEGSTFSKIKGGALAAKGTHEIFRSGQKLAARSNKIDEKREQQRNNL